MPLTREQICKLHDVAPTEDVLKCMDEWGKICEREERVENIATFIIFILITIMVIAIKLC